ncbi:MAG: GNAT family N-acetyltransferase [Gemmataceae bacterium]|nr:GNAT family N-acetyltransferase [Gemmataceae bacterium]
MSAPSFLIRPATAADLGAIRAIYNHYVLSSTCTYALEPETEEERAAWLAAGSERHPRLVAEVAGEVVGWAALSPWKTREGYAFTAEASVYVKEGFHRQGLGRALILALVEKGRAAGLHSFIGGACATQAASLALQESLGFVPVAHLREVGRKFGKWLDVKYMQLMLS